MNAASATCIRPPTPMLTCRIYEQQVIMRVRTTNRPAMTEFNVTPHISNGQADRDAAGSRAPASNELGQFDLSIRGTRRLAARLRQGWPPARGKTRRRGFSAAASPAPQGRRPSPFSNHDGLALGARNLRQSVIYRSDLEGGPPNGYESGGAVRAALGRGNPYERFGAGRYGAALLDLMVGEPVAYATGSPELKATGPFRTVSNSPITKSQRGFVCGGVPRTHPDQGRAWCLGLKWHKRDHWRLEPSPRIERM